jgi:hypothetical protein
MKINTDQKKIFFIGLPIIIFLLILHFLIPNSVFWGHIIALIFIWFFVLFISRTKEPLNYEAKFKPKSLSLVERGICPFCEKNSLSEYRIKVGYTKAKFWIGYYVFWIKYRYNRDEFVSSISLCSNCKEQYLKNKLFNPSLTVLEHKRGFSLGLKHPYDKSNIFIKDIY